MPRSSTSSRSSVPTPYHLRTPPARQLGVSITTVVMRGHRLRVRLPTSSQYAIPTSSPIQTEPESSPLPRLSGRHGLRRTRTVLESEQRSDSPRNHSHIEPMTATELTPSRNTVTTEGDDDELQSSVVDCTLLFPLSLLSNSLDSCYLIVQWTQLPSLALSSVRACLTRLTP